MSKICTEFPLAMQLKNANQRDKFNLFPGPNKILNVLQMFEGQIAVKCYEVFNGSTAKGIEKSLSRSEATHNRLEISSLALIFCSFWRPPDSGLLFAIVYNRVRSSTFTVIHSPFVHIVSECV